MTGKNLAAAVLVIASGCTGARDMTTEDMSSYQQLAADVSGQVQAYCSTAATMTTAAGCTTALQQYLDRVRPALAGMRPLAGQIDDSMMRPGGMHAGDMRCAMDAMSGELDRYAGVGCTSPDMATNRSEAQRHCDQMQGYADHMQMRGAEASGMMGSGMMGSGMGCGSDGGWMRPDGGMMTWDHQMPGCSADGG